MSDKKRFHVGDIVKVAPLRREGIILAVLEKNLYRVSVGNLSLQVSGDSLSDAIPHRVSAPKNPTTTLQSTVLPAKESEEIDLHGYTVVEGIKALETKINRSLIAKQYRLKVVHGLGSGRLKEGIHAFLSSAPYVASFKIDEFNPGVTWVYL